MILQTAIQTSLHKDSPFPQCPCKNCHLGALTHRIRGTAAQSGQQPPLHHWPGFSPRHMKLDQSAGLTWLARCTPLSNRKGTPSHGQLVTEWIRFLVDVHTCWGFPCGSAGKESAGNAGDLGSIPGLGISPGGRHGNPLQYSGLENSMDCIFHGVTKSWTRLSDFHFHTCWGQLPQGAM